MSIGEDKLLTRPQAAEILGLRVQTLAKWAMTGKYLPVVKLGSAARYRMADVQAYIERSTVPASS